MADEITDEGLAELRRLHEAATPGPWIRKWSSVVGAGDDSICTNGRGGNNHEWIDKGNLCMDLIAAMHTALPGLLSRLERVERERDEAIENARVASHDRRELMELTSAKKYGFGRGEALEARIATLERELARWRGCEQVEGDYVCKHEFECSQILRPRIATLERERDEARQSNARLNRRAQEAEAAAERLRKIEARIAERDTRKPLPRIEAAFALAAAEARIATLEAALRPFTHPDLMPILGGQCEGDQSPVYQRGDALLILGHFRAAAAALRGVEGK